MKKSAVTSLVSVIVPVYNVEKYLPPLPGFAG